MANVKLVYRNILETATVTVTTENSSFPKYRLYDRDKGKLFKGTAFASPFWILINQATTIYEVDRLIIPAGHNLNGLACSLRYSTDNFSSDDHEAVGWTQGDALIINKSFTAQTKQYWKLQVTAPATIVELTEMFLGKDYLFERNVKLDLTEETRRNMLRQASSSGYARWVKCGEKKEYRAYDLIAEGAQKTNLESWWSALDSVKPFYIFDHNSDLIFMEMLNELSFIPLSNSFWSTKLELLEVL
jgi:hypothetical protein